MQRASEWFARNPVAANLLMVFIVIGGLLGMASVRGETFPDVALDTLVIQVPYLGAAPEEVETAVCIRIEEAIEGIDGIDEIRSAADEGVCTVVVQVAVRADSRRVLDDIKTRVDAIETFPERTEKPIISEGRTQIRVVDIAVSGQADELALRTVAEGVRDDLVSLPQISQVEFASVRPYEISIEVSERALRRHGLTFDAVADAVRRSSLDLPGGSIRRESGEILLRTVGQAYRGAEFENLVLLARADGTRLRVGDVARVVDGFAETDQFGRLDGEPAVVLSVLRTGRQSDMAISRAVNDYLDRKAPTLPEGIRLTSWMNQAEVLIDRLGLMLGNGVAGLALVFALLAVFLELRLAFWVSLGIPISFLGMFMLMPGLDVTANIVSTFAFIMVLGIVVDDAIIVGENVYRHQRRGRDPLEGALSGSTGGGDAGLLRRPDHRGGVRSAAVRARPAGQDDALRAAGRHPLPAVLAGRIAQHPAGAPGPPAAGPAGSVVALPAHAGRRDRDGRRPRVPAGAGGVPALALSLARRGGVGAGPDGGAGAGRARRVPFLPRARSGCHLCNA